QRRGTHMRTVIRTNSPTTGLISPSYACCRALILLPIVIGLMINESKTVAAEVLTQRGGNERTGVYLDSKINQQLVTDHNRWDLLGTLPITGTIYAQPLYVENLAFPGGGSHNVVLVASALNVVKAFDADTRAELWRSELGANDTTKMEKGCDGLSGREGI